MLKTETFGTVTLALGDCVDFMDSLDDNAFDLAIVDPPYGINASGMQMGYGKKCWSKKDWDNEIPNKEFFTELFRVSQNQIIFGGNYFTDHLPASRCWLSWNKEVPTGMSFADFELAWTSFNQVAREIRCRYSGALQNGGIEVKIHPTQKPVTLYKWLIRNYAKDDDTILDTHLGSGSSALACHDMGFKMTGIELDKEYYEATKQRLINHQMQQKLF